MNIYGREKELCIHLDLQKRSHDGRMIGVIENNSGNANFILNIFINFCCKNDIGICLVNFLNPQVHYHHAGIKLGHNLKTAQESHKADIIDLLSIFRDQLLSSNMNSMLFGEDLIRLLVKKISERLEHLSTKHDRLFLIIDDLSVLQSLHVEEKQMRAFLQYLQILVTSPNRSRPGVTCSLVIVTHNDSKDKSSQRLAAAVRHAAMSIIDVTESKCTLFQHI